MLVLQAMAAILWRTVALPCSTAAERSGAAYGDLPKAVGVIKLCELCELHLCLCFFADSLLNFGQFGQLVNRGDLVAVPA